MSELADAGKVEKVHERLKFTEEEMKAISGLDIGLRFNDPADVSLAPSCRAFCLT